MCAQCLQAIDSENPLFSLIGHSPLKKKEKKSKKIPAVNLWLFLHAF